MNIIINTPQYVQELGNRNNQEDTIYPAPGQATSATKLFMVCDGMGGYESGEVASGIVATTMARELERHTDGMLRKETLLNALQMAYDALNAADTHPEEPVDNKMGTTLALLAFSEAGVLAMHMGDSRIYHFRPNSRQLLYRSKDHSYVQQLYDIGEINFLQMTNHPQKNVLVRAMRPSGENRQKPDIVQIVDIAPGDYFMLGSDGMFENTNEQQIMDILANSNLTDKEKAGRLADLAESSLDNHSAYLIGVDQVKRFDDDGELVDEEARVRAANQQLYTDLMSTHDTTQASLGSDRVNVLEPITAPAMAADDTDVAVEALEVTTPGRQRYTHEKGRKPAADSNKRSIIIGVLAMLLIFAMGMIAYMLFGGKSDNSDNRPPLPSTSVQPQKWSTQPTEQQATPVSAPVRSGMSKPETKPTPSRNEQTPYVGTAASNPGSGKRDKVDQILDQLGSNPQKPQTSATPQGQHHGKPNVASDVSNALGGNAKPTGNTGGFSDHSDDTPLDDTEN